MYESEVPAMYRYALKLTKNKDKAHDVVVDTIFSLANTDFSRIEFPKTYINKRLYWCYKKRKRLQYFGFDIEAHSHMVDRRISVKSEHVELDTDHVTINPNQEYATHLSEIYDTMSEISRDFYFNDMLQPEIAKKRGISQQRVSAVLKKDRKKWMT